MSSIKIIFLDMDGVMNSTQGTNYHYDFNSLNGTPTDDTGSWFLEGFSETAKQEPIFKIQEGQESDLCPIARTNLKYIMDKYPEMRIVISSTWRKRNRRTLEWWNWYFKELKIISEDRVIGMTPLMSGYDRGDEIQRWLDETEQTVDNFAILDDDSDMAHLTDTHHFIETDVGTGLDWKIVEKLDQLFGSFLLKFLDLKKGILYKMFSRHESVRVFWDGKEEFFYFNREERHTIPVKLINKITERFALA